METPYGIPGSVSRLETNRRITALNTPINAVGGGYPSRSSRKRRHVDVGKEGGNIRT